MDLSPVPFPNGKGCLLDEQRRIVANLGSVQARLASLRELQSATGEELRPFFGRTLLPSVYNDQKEKT